ncbi:MAG: hypothetical protein ACOYZ8_00785 [Chloroflexota bacterium]
MNNRSLNQLLRSVKSSSIIGESAENIQSVEFGDISNFIQEINIPRTIRVGSEIVSTTRPFLVLARKQSVLKEIFSKPFFSYTKRLRIRFHWNGLQVIGSGMESPNCFVLNVPSHNKTANWYLKLSCLPDCSTGEKPLYISVDAYRENIFLKAMSMLTKLVAALALIITVALPFLYYLSDSIRMYINRAIIGEADTGYVTIMALVVFSFVLFSKRIDEIFSSLFQEHITVFLIERGVKMITLQGIRVLKKS